MSSKCVRAARDRYGMNQTEATMFCLKAKEKLPGITATIRREGIGLANDVKERIEEHMLFTDQSFETAKEHVQRAIKIQIDNTTRIRRNERERKATEYKKKCDDAKRKRELDSKVLQTKIALDAELKRLNDTQKIPVTYEVKPRVTEKAYCVFCEEFHPTKIMVSSSKILSFPINGYHVSPLMKFKQNVKYDAYDDTKPTVMQEPKNIDRCIQALMENKQLSEEDARERCENMLVDAATRHHIRCPTIMRTRTTQSLEDKEVAKIIDTFHSTGTYLHPEQATFLWEEKADKLNEYIQKLIATGQLRKMKRRR